jgi:mycoredoxin
MSALPTPDVITVYSAPWCGHCTRLKAQLTRQGSVYVEVDVDGQPDVLEALAAANDGAWLIPTVALPNGQVLVNPSAREVAAAAEGASPAQALLRLIGESAIGDDLLLPGPYGPRHENRLLVRFLVGPGHARLGLGVRRVVAVCARG